MSRRRYSPDVLRLNPDLAAHTTKAGTDAPVDGANTLRDHARRLLWSAEPHLAKAAALIVGMERERPFQRWRIDLADAATQTAVEVNGGRWQPGGGKHGTSNDRAKCRALQIAGWIVLEYLTEDITRDPAAVIVEIARVIRDRTATHWDPFSDREDFGL